MMIIPAIDIIGGKVVRLEKGDFNKEKIYSDDPLEIAKYWEKRGAEFLHIVDLDGAREGKMKNQDIITKIIENIRTPCEVGGGIRDKGDVEYFLNSGARRVILSTRAFEDPRYLEGLIGEFREKIVVGIDFSGNEVVKKGWQETTNLSPMFIVLEMQKIGVKTIVVTDMDVDGTLKGPKIERLKQILNAVHISVIVSGGISSLKDIKKLKEIKNFNLEGVIIGKALYEGKINLQEAMELC
nr:1-(5-phosphoribosyl)-5-[(5-phosphoribosylamino)methylideneamino]imidazole-4-carboxamide isomerase [Candidatus Omnitrophota bacterium]